MKVNIGTYPKGNQKRKIDVQIDEWDTWCLDHTLAHIIYPALLQFRTNSSGQYPGTFDNPKEWAKVLDKMIWSFGEILNDEGEDQFFTGVHDIVWAPVNAKHEVTFDEDEVIGWRTEDGPKATNKFDKAGYIAYHKKIQEGVELFGKHFQSLWT